MAQFKKPADTNFLKGPYIPIAQDLLNVKDKDLKAPPNHIQSVSDAVTCFFWYTAPGQDDCVDFLKENHGNIFFYGNKILKQNSEKDTNWINALTELSGALKDFIIPRAETILNWTGNEDSAGAKAFFESQCSAGSSVPQATPQQT